MTCDRVKSALPVAVLTAAKRDWLPLLWFGGLLGLSYAFVLIRLGKQWLSDDDMNHGMFVPPLIAFIIWRRWSRLRELPVESNAWGVPLIIIGGSTLCIGPPSLPTFVFLSRIGFVFSLLGLILFLRGSRTVYELTYPFLLTCLMIPLPGFVFQKLTIPLQFLASIISEQLLSALGYSVLREGNILHLPSQTLNVAEACSGLRSLLSLSFLAQAYAYLFDRSAWMRLALGIAIIPVAVFANACRIGLSAMMAQVNPDWAHGSYHVVTGWTVFLISFVFLLILHRAIRFATTLPQRRAAINAVA